jgi:hypothetical protein
MPDYQPVTDPDILQQLNAGSNVPRPVTDPALLEQLNAPQQPPTILNKLAQTWPARMAQDIYSAVKLPGDVYQGNTQVDVNNPEFMKRVTTLGGVAPTSVLPSITASAPTVKQLIQRGGNQIDEAINSGLMFQPAQVQEGINAIRQQLPTRRVSQATHDALDALEEKTNSGMPITLKDIAQSRDELLAVQKNSAKSTALTAATDLSSSTTAKHGLDDIVRGTPEGDLFITGNANYAGGKASEGLDKRLYRSELRAASANSGRNIGNTIKSNITSLLLSPEARTLTPEIRQQAEALVYGTRPENFMRHWGNVLGGGGGLGQALTMGGSGALGYLASGGNPTIAGIAAGTLPIAGAVLKHGANEAAISHLEALSNALRANTPLGQTSTRGTFAPANADAKAALIRALLAGAGQQQ